MTQEDMSSIEVDFFASKFDREKFNSLILDESLIDFDGSPFETWQQATIELLINFAINHDVILDREHGNLVYSGSSPDEIALVNAASHLGVTFLEAKGNNLIFSVGKVEFEYELIHKFKFTSERGRSSVIVRDNEGDYLLYVKGADNIMFNRIDEFSERYLMEAAKDHASLFAKQGLRTLCYAMKKLSESEFSNFQKKYNEFLSVSFDDDSENTTLRLIDQLERDLVLVGISALEDRLQDNVETTIKELKEAEINVWMITGDKLDTAESIGYSSKLFSDDCEIYRITDQRGELLA